MTRIHFLNVGHGDCTIIEHPSGRITMVDINNAESLDDDSHKEIAAEYGAFAAQYTQQRLLAQMLGGTFQKMLWLPDSYDVPVTDPVAYYLAHWGKTPIFRFIQTHADLDHMRGLKRLNQEGIEILNFWDTDHQKEIPEFTGNDEADWKEYSRLRTSTTSPKVFHHFAGARNKYWNMDDAGGSGDGIHILTPTAALRDAANLADDINAHSYVLWLEYAGVKTILGGDATYDVWDSIFNTFGKNLKCDVLKASHHGRDSGYHQEAVKAMAPSFTIVSVGTKPETDASAKYRQYSQNVWSTRWKGSIVVTIPANGQGSIDCQYKPKVPAIAANYNG
jgi:competence protein ComEC